MMDDVRASNLCALCRDNALVSVSRMDGSLVFGALVCGCGGGCLVNGAADAAVEAAVRRAVQWELHWVELAWPGVGGLGLGLGSVGHRCIYL